MTRILPVELINQHAQQTDPYQQYLHKSEAALTYATAMDIDVEITEHLNGDNPHGIDPEMIGAATPGDIDSAIASHESNPNPHSQLRKDFIDNAITFSPGWQRYSTTYPIFAHSYGSIVLLAGLISRIGSSSNQIGILNPEIKPQQYSLQQVLAHIPTDTIHYGWISTLKGEFLSLIATLEIFRG